MQDGLLTSTLAHPHPHIIAPHPSSLSSSSSFLTQTNTHKHPLKTVPLLPLLLLPPLLPATLVGLSQISWWTTWHDSWLFDWLPARCRCPIITCLLICHSTRSCNVSLFSLKHVEMRGCPKKTETLCKCLCIRVLG